MTLSDPARRQVVQYPVPRTGLSVSVVGHESSRIALAVAALILPIVGSAGGGQFSDDHTKMMEATSATDAPIEVIINPEARVTVALAGTLPATQPCGQATEFLVSVLNHSFATAKLEARLVGGVPSGVRFEFRSEALKGVEKETRRLEITLMNPGSVDITIAFTTHNNVPDLAGRDRVHLLLQCALRAS